MHRVLIFNKKGFRINKTQIVFQVKKTIKEQSVENDTSVNISFIDDSQMIGLHKKHLHKKGTTDVLSFPLHEKITAKTAARWSPDNVIGLGDIVISYPQAKRQAAEAGITVDEEINNLVDHGVKHLLGRHHEE